MISESSAQELIGRLLSYSAADETEISITTTDSGLTRFANNGIHQNVAEVDSSLTVRAILGKRIGVATLNNANLENGRKAVDRAIELARLQSENELFPGLPSAPAASKVNAFVDATASSSPDSRAKGIAEVCRRSVERGLVASGSLQVSATALAIGNSLGTFQYHPSTEASLSVVAMSDSGSGYADSFALDVDAIDVGAVGDEAMARAVDSADPVEIPPEEYTVILEPYAAGDLLDFLTYLGFGGQAVEEGRSFMAGKFGKRVLGANISIWDDGYDPTGIPSPFDFEGVPRQRVTLIESGVARNVCYDSYTAARVGKETTGHSLPAGETFGPVPLNLFMAAGASSKDQMIASTKRGLLITRFWYTRPVHPLRIVVTGMTRDGTFLIKDGEVVGPVKNLRFTQSYIEALNQVEEISEETKIERSMFAANRVPILKINGFRFVSGT